ncbi:MAG: hypothetical protein QG662_2448 [Pseudomonadota bacterium]|nr:hypothetical protein [Pseudomonadota bacterium]
MSEALTPNVQIEGRAAFGASRSKKDPAHFEGAVKRIERELAQARLFA